LLYLIITKVKVKLLTIFLIIGRVFFFCEVAINFAGTIAAVCVLFATTMSDWYIDQGRGSGRGHVVHFSPKAPHSVQIIQDHPTGIFADRKPVAGKIRLYFYMISFIT